MTRDWTVGRPYHIPSFVHDSSIYKRSLVVASLGMLGVVLVFALASVVLTLMRILFLPRKWENWYVWACSPMLMKCLGLRAEVRNRELYRTDEPCVVISNHSSLDDVPIIYYATSGTLRMLSKRELFWVPFIGWGMLASHFVGVRRGHRKSGEQAQRTIGKRLKGGFQIYMAPEGTRSPDGRLLPFKTGAFRIAKMHNVPVVVLALENPWEILPKGDILPRRGGVVRATFLGRIEAAQITGNTGKSGLSAEDMLKRARDLFLKHGFVES